MALFGDINIESISSDLIQITFRVGVGLTEFMTESKLIEHIGVTG